MASLESDSLRGKAMRTAAAMMLIDEGADLRYARRSDGVTAFKFAVNDCPLEVIQALITRGAEVNTPEGADPDRRKFAVRVDKVESLRVLVECGANLSFALDRWTCSRSRG